MFCFSEKTEGARSHDQICIIPTRRYELSKFTCTYLKNNVKYKNPS